MGIEEFSRGKEDFLKVLSYLKKLVEEIGKTEIDWWWFIEQLYEKRDEFRFTHYFCQQTYFMYDFREKKTLPYDPNLINDLILLRSIGVLNRNDDGTYEIDKKTLELLVEDMDEENFKII